MRGVRGAQIRQAHTTQWRHLYPTVPGVRAAQREPEMIRTTRKATVYRCDNPQCRAQHTAPYTSRRLAWEHAKAAGWLSATPDGKRWFQFCSWVHRPHNERQLLELANG